MLAGRYPSHEFGELRPRIAWDRPQRASSVARGRQAAGHHQRRHHSRPRPVRRVHGRGRRARGRAGRGDGVRGPPGRGVQLGASSWRIERSTRDRVLVSPAPGVPGKLPFWKGDGIGRPYELGQAVGRPRARGHSGRLDPLGGLATSPDYLNNSGARPPGPAPSARSSIERFHDELGDWRICVLSPFGARVNAPWALRGQARIPSEPASTSRRCGPTTGSSSACPTPMPAATNRPDRRTAGDAGRAALTGSPKSACSRPVSGENAARALLLPRRRPNMRTPLWQQRLKGARSAAGRQALRLVSDHARDLPRGALRRVRGAAAKAAAPGDRQRPGAAGRGRVGTALAVCQLSAVRLHRKLHVRGRRSGRRTADETLTLDRALLAELLAADDLRELLDAEAIAEVNTELQGLGGSLTADTAHDLLRRVGALTADELGRRGASGRRSRSS